MPVVPTIDPNSLAENCQAGAVAANHAALSHINTYGPLPYFYADKPFTCRDCGVEEVWRATQQKWYYEVVKGHIDAIAIRCRACQRKANMRKAQARVTSEAGRAAKADRNLVK